MLDPSNYRSLPTFQLVRNTYKLVLDPSNYRSLPTLNGVSVNCSLGVRPFKL